MRQEKSAGEPEISDLRPIGAVVERGAALAGMDADSNPKLSPRFCSKYTDLRLAADSTTFESSVDAKIFRMNATIVDQHAGTQLSRAELRARWRQMLRDPMLADVPGKLELTDKGTIELSPANTRHGILQAFVTRELHRSRPDGTTITECAVETDIGIRVPDVVWASPQFMDRHGTTSPLPSAPELCVEVLSPGNTKPEMQRKTAAYLAAGAIEVWIVAEDGTVETFDGDGRVAESSLGIAVGPTP